MQRLRPLGCARRPAASPAGPETQCSAVRRRSLSGVTGPQSPLLFLRQPKCRLRAIGSGRGVRTRHLTVGECCTFALGASEARTLHPLRQRDCCSTACAVPEGTDLRSVPRRHKHLHGTRMSPLRPNDRRQSENARALGLFRVQPLRWLAHQPSEAGSPNTGLQRTSMRRPGRVK